MGFCSWKTQDTNESISNVFSTRGPLGCKMVCPVTGREYPEREYEGYGSFNGVDFYQLLAQINGLENESDPRGVGIALFFQHYKTNSLDKIKLPILVSLSYEGDYSNLSQLKDCEYQGYFYPIEHKIEAFDAFLQVHLDICSINIIRTDEGVVVDVWEKDFKGAEPIVTTYAYDTELNPENES